MWKEEGRWWVEDEDGRVDICLTVWGDDEVEGKEGHNG